MDKLIYPGIFNNDVTAFFTGKTLGADIEKICAMLSIRKEKIYLPIQRHTDNVLILDSDNSPKIADAVVTKRKGIIIGVQVADCVPVLLCDEHKGVLGVVHAGWRGTAAKIVIKTIKIMMELFNSLPGDILMAQGPSIKGDCYYVDDEVKDAVLRATGDGDYYALKNGKYCVDLPAANMLQALSLGVPAKNIWSSTECTHCNPHAYHSYRYHKDHAGRQGGFIGILK
jgi:polyphenol oxidase